MSFNLSQLGQIAQKGEGSKKPGPKPRMALPKKKKKKVKKKNSLTTSPGSPEELKSLEATPSAAVATDAGLSCSPLLPPLTPQDVIDRAAPVTQPPTESSLNNELTQRPWDGSSANQRGNDGECAVVDEMRISSASNACASIPRNAAKISGAGDSAVEGSSRRGSRTPVIVEREDGDVYQMDVDERDLKGGSERLPNNLDAALKKRKTTEGVDSDVHASKKSKKRKSKSDGAASKPQKNSRKANNTKTDGDDGNAAEEEEDGEKQDPAHENESEGAIGGKEKDNSSQDAAASNPVQLEKKKKKRKKNSRQEELERLLAVKDVTTLPLCDIVTRVNYEELRNKKKEALKKKEKEAKEGKIEEKGEGDARKPSSDNNRAGPSAPQQVLAPQVTVVDGKIVLNQQSLEVAGKGPTIQQFERVEEGEDRIVNSATYSNWTKPKRWSEDETHLFFQCVKQFGTDFTLLETLVPGRTRQQLREKYKREAKKDPLRFYQRLAPGNAMDDDFGMEDNELYQKLYEDLKSKRISTEQAALPAPSEIKTSPKGGEPASKKEVEDATQEKASAEQPAEQGNEMWGQGHKNCYDWDEEEDYFY